MFINNEWRRFVTGWTLPLLSCTLMLAACGEGGLGGGPDTPETPADPERSTKLTITTAHATNSSMELSWALFDARGAVVLDPQSKKAIRGVASVDLKGKAYELPVGALVGGSTVAVLGFVSQTTGDTPTLNEAITNINEPMVVAAQGAMLVGDFFYGKFTAPNEPTAVGEVHLERISGQMALRLAGDEALVASVLRVEFDFEGAPFYNGVAASGVLLKAAEGYTGVSAIPFVGQERVYMLPSVVKTGDRGKGRIYYGSDQVKWFAWNAEDALRMEANQQTTVTLTLSSVKPDPEQVSITLASSYGLVDGVGGSIDNGLVGKGYYTYKLLGTLSKADFIPGAMVLDGEWLYVGNNMAIQEGMADSENQKTYSVEAFNIETMLHLGTLPRDWTIETKKSQFVGAPRALALSDGRLYAAYSQAPFTRVVVYDLLSGGVETCIGTGFAAAAMKDDSLAIDEPMSIYADKGYVYLIDNYCAMRIYKESEITKKNYSKIVPFAKSVKKNVGKPHIVSMFRAPDGTLYRTDYTTQKLLAIDPSKIVASNELNIMNPALDIDLTGAMFDDTSISGLLSTMLPYGVAYHHGNMFVAVASEDDSGKREGYLSEYSADGKTFIRSLRYMDGYTVKRPVAIITTGDKMIISDQLNENIAIIQITYHPTVHYE